MILRFLERKHWCTSITCAIFIALQVYLDLKIPEYMSAITDAVVASEPPSVIIGYGLSMIYCALGSVAVSFVAALFATMTATSLCHSLRKRLFDKVCSFSPEDVGRYSVDSLITRCSNDVTQMQRFLTEALQLVVKTPIITVWALLKISGAEMEWSIVTVIGILIIAGFISWIILSTYPRFRLIPILTDHINHSSLEHLTGLRVVRAYNAERFQESKFEEVTSEMRDNGLYLWKRSSILPALSSATSNFLTLAIYWTGIGLIVGSGNPAHQVVLFSDMIVFSSYMIQVVGTFIQFSFFIQFSSRALASSKRVQELLLYEQSMGDGTYKGGKESEGTVEFREVSFTYPGTTTEVLHDISFKVERGQTMAIIGSTGSGKSTLAKLLLRFYAPSQGNILVDGTDIMEYCAESLYDRIGYVPQTSTMFTGSIDENVRFGKNSHIRTDQDVWEALRISQAEEFVSDLPDREGTHISEGGTNLSGGQKQRISVARAICKGADITVMDDPFSALDFATDRRLRSSLKKNFSDMTCIMITQRVGTAKDADLILVLDDGRQIGLGTHSELVRNCPLYRELAISQMVEGTE